MSDLSFDDLKRIVSRLQKDYPDDLDTGLLDEAVHFTEHCSLSRKDSRYSILEQYEWFTRMNLKTIYPNVDIIFRLCICLPVSNCSAERSFSCLRRIKSYFRSATGQERLEAMAILNIESELTNTINFEDIIKEFAGKKVRKKNFD